MELQPIFVAATQRKSTRKNVDRPRNRRHRARPDQASARPSTGPRSQPRDRAPPHLRRPRRRRLRTPGRQRSQDEAAGAPARGGDRGAKPGALWAARRVRTPADQRPGSLAADPVHGVLAVVVDERGVLLPVRTAAAEWHLLGTDHHVVDVILAYKRRRRRIAAEDEFVVGALLNVIGEAIGPQPPGVADQLTPP